MPARNGSRRGRGGRGRALSVMGSTVAGGRIVAADVLRDPARLAAIDLATPDG